MIRLPLKALRAIAVFAAMTALFVSCQSEGPTSSSDQPDIAARALAVAATPVFKPAGGTYTSMQTVTITSTTTGAKVYYTTNGTTPTSASTLYAAAFNVGASKTVKAIAIANGYTNSAVASATYVIKYPPATAATFSVASGTYTSSQSVTIKSTTPGATIYYTLDGTTPTTASPKYTSAISIVSSKTLKAIVVAPGYVNSTVTSASYTIQLSVAAPTFTPASGTYTSMRSVTIKSSTTGAKIYYTMDGTAPTTASTLYAGAFDVGASKTVKAIAVAAGYSNSPVTTATYVINYPTAAAPVFSLASGAYTSAQTVRITSAAAGATIYYTVDGTTPTSASLKYAGAISISSSRTLKAIAMAPGYSNSPVATATYVINATPAPALASITVGGKTMAISSTSPTTISWELEAATKTVVVSAKATDANATVLLGTALNSTTINFSSSLTSSLAIKVSNGTGTTKIYTLNLTVPTTGVFTDLRDGRKYAATLVGSSWMMTSSLNYAGTGSCPTGDCSTSGRFYTWSQAMNNGSGQNIPEQGICPVGWYIPDQTTWSNMLSQSADLNIPGMFAYYDGLSSSFWLPYEANYGGPYVHMYFSNLRSMPFVGSADMTASVRCYKP